MQEAAPIEWISLVPGNTRLHWGKFSGGKLIEAWHTRHIEEEDTTEDVHILATGTSQNQTKNKDKNKNKNKNAKIAENDRNGNVREMVEKNDTNGQIHKSQESCGPDCASLYIYVADVVPSQTSRVKDKHALVHVLPLSQALEGQYETMGKDRVLSLLGALQAYRCAALVIDAGTAITYSGIDSAGVFVGGAILPGLSTQLKSLYEKTEKLPLIPVPETPPKRFVTDTASAIQSGVVYHALSGVSGFIRAWEKQYPGSLYVFTGGDGKFLHDNVEGAEQLRSCFNGDLMHIGVQRVVDTMNKKCTS